MNLTGRQRASGTVCLPGARYEFPFPFNSLGDRSMTGPEVALRWLADENFNNDILRALLRRSLTSMWFVRRTPA
jgi:hypothetical protein